MLAIGSFDVSHAPWTVKTCTRRYPGWWSAESRFVRRSRTLRVAAVSHCVLPSLAMHSTEGLVQMIAEALASKEKTLKLQGITTALFLGVLVGIAVWSATHKGGFLPFVLLFIAPLIGSTTPQQARELQGVQSETRRRTARH